jgi:3-hydroxy acid dehydrogenase / malonic semialdehyde reductase
MNKTVFISGATSGIGLACAQKFASESYNLIITGRRKDRLEKITKELQQLYRVEVLPICFDVQNRTEVFQHLSNLPKEWQEIDVVINNAGLALGRESFEVADLNDWDVMMDTNVKGLAYVTRALLPYMISRTKGHIINMGSVAGKDVYEKGNGYCASKFAVDALSKSMRIDLLPHNIKVTAIHPGAVETEFSLIRFKGDAEKAAATYAGLQALSGADVADAIFYCASLPAHVCVNDIVITPTQQANGIHIHKK